MAMAAKLVEEKVSALTERRVLEIEDHRRKIRDAVAALGAGLDQLRVLIERDRGAFAWACSIPYQRDPDAAGELERGLPPAAAQLLRVDPVAPAEARARIGAFLRRIAFAKDQLGDSALRLPAIAAVDEKTFEAAEKVNDLKTKLKNLTADPVLGEAATTALRRARSHDDDQTHLSVRQATRQLTLLASAPARVSFVWERRGFSSRTIELNDAYEKYKPLSGLLDELPGETKFAERFEVPPAPYMNYREGGKGRKVGASGPVFYLAPLTQAAAARAAGPQIKPLETLDLGQLSVGLDERKDRVWVRLHPDFPLYYRPEPEA